MSRCGNVSKNSEMEKTETGYDRHTDYNSTKIQTDCVGQRLEENSEEVNSGGFGVLALLESSFPKS